MAPSFGAQATICPWAGELIGWVLHRNYSQKSTHNGKNRRMNSEKNGGKQNMRELSAFNFCTSKGGRCCWKILYQNWATFLDHLILAHVIMETNVMRPDVSRHILGLLVAAPLPCKIPRMLVHDCKHAQLYCFMTGQLSQSAWPKGPASDALWDALYTWYHIVYCIQLFLTR